LASAAGATALALDLTTERAELVSPAGETMASSPCTVVMAESDSIAVNTALAFDLDIEIAELVSVATEIALFLECVIGRAESVSIADPTCTSLMECGEMAASASLATDRALDLSRATATALVVSIAVTTDRDLESTSGRERSDSAALVMERAFVLTAPTAESDSEETSTSLDFKCAMATAVLVSVAAVMATVCPLVETRGTSALRTLPAISACYLPVYGSVKAW
jgi:hypothetical protein